MQSREFTSDEQTTFITATAVVKNAQYQSIKQTINQLVHFTVQN